MANVVKNTASLMRLAQKMVMQRWRKPETWVSENVAILDDGAISKPSADGWRPDPYH